MNLKVRAIKKEKNKTVFKDVQRKEFKSKWKMNEDRKEDRKVCREM